MNASSPGQKFAVVVESSNNYAELSNLDLSSRPVIGFLTAESVLRGVFGRAQETHQNFRKGDNTLEGASSTGALSLGGPNVPSSGPLPSPPVSATRSSARSPVIFTSPGKLRHSDMNHESLNDINLNPNSISIESPSSDESGQEYGITVKQERGRTHSAFLEGVDPNINLKSNRVDAHVTGSQSNSCHATSSSSSTSLGESVRSFSLRKTAGDKAKAKGYATIGSQ